MIGQISNSYTSFPLFLLFPFLLGMNKTNKVNKKNLAIYFILKSYLDKADGSDEKEMMEKLARIAVKFVKYGNLKLDKLLSNLRKPEKSPEERLKNFVAKHVDKFSGSQIVESPDSKKEPEQLEQ